MALVLMAPLAFASLPLIISLFLTPVGAFLLLTAALPFWNGLLYLVGNERKDLPSWFRYATFTNGLALACLGAATLTDTERFPAYIGASLIAYGAAFLLAGQRLSSSK